MSHELCQQNNLFFIRKLRKVATKKTYCEYYLYLTRSGDWSRDFESAAKSSSAEEIENYLIKIVKTITL